MKSAALEESAVLFVKCAMGGIGYAGAGDGVFYMDNTMMPRADGSGYRKGDWRTDMTEKTSDNAPSGDKGEAGKSGKGGGVARWIGISAGIGSAAVAAAVLYANRDRLKSRKPSPRAEDAQD